MNAIVIGQYIKGNSLIHKLDPRSKILSMILLIVALFLVPMDKGLLSIYALLIFTVLTFIIFLLSRISIIRMLRGLKPLLFLLIFTICLQLFYNSEGTKIIDDYSIYISLTGILGVLVIITFYTFTKKYIYLKSLYFILIVVSVFVVLHYLTYIPLLSDPLFLHFTDKSLIRAAFLFIRVCDVVIISSILTFTTSTTDLNNGLSKLMSPLKIIHFPVDIVSMMLSLTLRHIPTLLEEAGKIMSAQASRGSDFKEGNIKDKIVQIISLLVPMFIISFQRADDLSMAMEVRGYVIGGKRTSIDRYKIKIKDIFSISISLIVLAAAIFFIFL
ncbi:MAG: energy-coupling factor transporter transmembrane protein EcfT [Acholeplasmatales bacterium]|jgi:energy-coupling factor transport system permease protein|nr:energy-coupling factor transporter transmembrane protein EcfT [Acholeplasmatales bacterium]